MTVHSHSDLLKWLQGEVQHYLPHEMMLAAWGDFSSDHIRYDIVSGLTGVRTAHLETASLFPLLRRLYSRWIESGRMACIMGAGESDILQQEIGQQCAFGTALQGMHFTLLHGISDKRERYDCLYVIFSSEDRLKDFTLSALEILLPYLDTALRRVTPLTHPYNAVPPITEVPSRRKNYGLSAREVEIMHWVRIGKTNAEIASILEISLFTVKNHMQHVFNKLDVYTGLRLLRRLTQPQR